MEVEGSGPGGLLDDAVDYPRPRHRFGDDNHDDYVFVAVVDSAVVVVAAVVVAVVVSCALPPADHTAAGSVSS